MPSLLNEQIDDQLLFERQESFSGGEDNYRRSTLIDPDQCQKLVNIIVRDNYEAWTRPGADKFTESAGTESVPLLADDGTPLLADDGSPLLADETEAVVTPVRTLEYFDTPNNRWVLAICNGKLKACSGVNVGWQLASPSYTCATDLRVEIVQGVDTCLISDGVGALATLDSGLGLTTCTTGANDPPVGATMLCWHTGRMFATGIAATPDTIWVSNRLAFGNGQWNGTTRSFRIGSGDGDPITALHSVHDSLLAVFKANSIWLVDTNPATDIADWSAKDLGKVLGFGVGCVGKRAVASTGNDVFFMAQDGVRSLQRMEAAAGQWQLSAPISQPVQQYINRINRAQQSKIEATAFKEFVMFAIPLDSSTTNNAVLVFNTRLSRWIGCWTGWTPSAFCKSRFSSIEQLLMGDSTGLVNVWKESNDSNLAATYLDNGVNIAGQKVYTRAFQFGDPVSQKEAYNCLLRFTAGSCTLNISAWLDLVSARTFQKTVSPLGDLLGVGKLGSFRLASVSPSKVEKSLRSLASFNELYLRIEAESGWFKLRNITLSAFPKAYTG